MKKILIILSIIISLLVITKEKDKITIPTDAIRIRIIANSSSLEDQMTKLKVKDNVEKMLYEKLNNIKNISEARVVIKNNLNVVDKVVNDVTNTSDYKIDYGYNYFPKKDLYGIDYEAGEYESLVIKIGEAKGNNWWCVLFPPLCLLDIDKSDKDNVNYKSKVLEIIREYK